jgi:hypothetical protein
MCRTTTAQALIREYTMFADKFESLCVKSPLNSLTRRERNRMILTIDKPELRDEFRLL